MNRNASNRDKLNILVIMLHWYPYEGPLMPIYGSILKALMDRGHRVTIVTSFPHFRRGRPETWKEFRGRWAAVTRWHDAKLIRCYVLAPVFHGDKAAFFYRALNFVSFNISCIITAVFFGGKANLVFAPSSPPLTNGISAWLVSLFKRCPVIYNVQDLYPDMAEAAGLLKSRLLLGLMKLLEKAVYRVSNRILLLSEGMRANVMGKGVCPSKTSVIPNFIDTAYVAPFPKRNPFSERWGIANAFVALYAGNMGVPHGTEIIVEAADILKSRHDILFCFVSRGEYKDRLEKMVRDRNLENVLFIPPQREKEVPFVWASGDVALVTYGKGLAGFSMPSKLLAAMMSARPVIAAVDTESETFSMIKNARCGLLTPPANAFALAKSILYLYRRRHWCETMGKRGRTYAETHFSKEAVVNAYEAFFQNVAGVAIVPTKASTEHPLETQGCH